MFWIVAAACAAIDQLSKYAVVSLMEPGSCVELIPGILSFTYTRNTGAAFSILQGRQSFLIAVTLALCAGLTAYVLRKGGSMFFAEKLAIALIVGGGAGNLLCRIFRGYVVDFIDIRVIPIFNAADIFVCCGCALLALSVLVLEPRAAEAKDAAHMENADVGRGKDI